jgi:DNA polymerase-3 subunit delta
LFYLFHGDDEHTKSKTLANLQRKLGDPSLIDLNTNRFDGQSLNLGELRHACDSIPFLAKKRLVVVKDLAQAKPSFMDQLLAYLHQIPETTRLVFLESKALPASHPLLKAAKSYENGYVKLFERPQGSRLESWIRQQGEVRGGQIEPKAAHLLAINVGDNLIALENEVEKLVLFKGDRPVTADDVMLLCPYVAEASIFDLVDAIGSRHAKTAARLLVKKLGEGTDPFYLFAMIVRQFRLLIQVKELAVQKMNPPHIAREIGIHGFVAGKLAKQSNNYTFEQLEKIYAHLLDVDVAVKTGQNDMETALTTLVAGITL